MMKIVQAPNEVLSSSAKRIEKIDSGVKKIIEQMKIALDQARDPEGVGLAAPQIGKSLRIFIAKPNPKKPVMVFLNPEIKSFSDDVKNEVSQSKKTEKAKEKSGIKKGKQLEGCLSLKDIWGTVNRHSKIKLSYMDDKGLQHEEEFEGFLATIIQHETDHLNGILFPKRVLEQKGQLYKSSKDEKGEDVFDEINL